MRPSRVLPPVEFWRGVRPRKAANSRPLAKALASWIVAVIADAVTGSTPGMVINRLAVSSALTDAASSLSIAPMASSDKRTKRAAHAIGDDDLAILVETVGSHALQAIGMLRALRRDEADLGQMAAQSVERRRALAGEQLARPRWRISSAWFSIERTGTNRWPGRLIASWIAAASTWSFLLRRT